MLIHPQSEFIREPNLLVPGKKPLGPVRLQMSSGVFVDQWLHGGMVLPSNRTAKRVSANAEHIGQGIRFEPADSSEKDHYTLLGALQRTITTRPFGFVGVGFARVASASYGVNYGHFGMLRQTTSSTTRSFVQGYCFRGRPFRIIQKVGYGTQLALNTANYNANSLAVGDTFACGFMSTAADSHKIYARINDGPIDTGTSTTDRSGIDLDYDSISLGGCREYDNFASTYCYRYDALTMVIMHGAGVTDALMQKVIYDPYQFLVPA